LGIPRERVTATVPRERRANIRRRHRDVGEAHIDLTDFEAADFGHEGVVVELLREDAELDIAVS
jgi:hypothetical protein